MRRSKAELPVPPSHRVTSTLDGATTSALAHRTPLTSVTDRNPGSTGAERNRQGYRRNSLAHAPRVGTTTPRTNPEENS